MTDSIYDAMETDPNLESGDGIVIDYGKYGKFKLHRAGGANRKYARIFEAKYKPYRYQVQQNTLDEKTASRIHAEVFAESVVLGWDGVKGRDGKPIPYSQEACVKLLTDLPALFTQLMTAATDIANFRKVAKDDDVKNSSKS